MNSYRFINIALIIFIGLFSLLACTDEESYTMDIDKLTLVIKDLNLIELLIENKPVEIKDSLQQLNLNRICSIHQTSMSDIEHDLELISTDFELLDSIYSRIILMDTTSKANSQINTSPK